MAKFDKAGGRYVYLPIHGVEYRVYFEENGSGIPLLCQHTAGSDGQQWRHILNDKEISSRFRIIVPDLPYHGKSLPPESTEWWKQGYRLTKDFFVDFYVQLNRALELDRPIFLGGCMGGCIGPYLAQEHPDEFRAVIGLEVVSSGGEGPPDFWDHPRISNHFKAAMMWSLMAPIGPEKYRRETLWGFGQGGASVLRGDFYFYFEDHDLSEKARQIDTSRVSVYLLTGEYDPVVTPEDTQRLADQIKGAKFIEMKELGHLSLSENPEVLKKYLMPVFDEITSNGII